MTERAKDAHEESMCGEWWATAIIDMRPGVIRYFGYPIEELIGNVSFAEMVWLMLRGELPSHGEAQLLDTLLMSSVDHGPQAPSIAVARMAATCGVGLNNAISSAVNTLGDVHGGAGEEAVELLYDLARQIDAGCSLQDVVASALDGLLETKGRYLPGFGHRFHDVDPRALRLMEVVAEAAEARVVTGRYRQIALELEEQLAAAKEKRIPMNIDGASAVICAELDFAAPLARGLFCLSRSVGILAHAWEQLRQGGRNKGPIPPDVLPRYTGPGERHPPKRKRRWNADRQQQLKDSDL